MRDFDDNYYKDDSYLFEKFNFKVVDTKNPADPVATEMKKIAQDNGLSLVFNKVGMGGGAAVMPPANQVTVNLVQGSDNKWRVRL